VRESVLLDGPQVPGDYDALSGCQPTDVHDEVDLVTIPSIGKAEPAFRSARDPFLSDCGPGMKLAKRQGPVPAGSYSLAGIRLIKIAKNGLGTRTSLSKLCELV
jgi:hypothetical protein